MAKLSTGWNTLAKNSTGNRRAVEPLDALNSRSSRSGLHHTVAFMVFHARGNRLLG
jgi:hypothetical protein